MSCTRSVLSRAPSSSHAPHSQCACMEKAQKSLRYFLKSSGVTAQVQSNGNFCQTTTMFSENVKLLAQRSRTCSVPAVLWAKGHVLSTLPAVVAPAAPELPLQHC